MTERQKQLAIVAAVVVVALLLLLNRGSKSNRTIVNQAPATFGDVSIPGAVIGGRNGDTLIFGTSGGGSDFSLPPAQFVRSPGTPLTFDGPRANATMIGACCSDCSTVKPKVLVPYTGGGGAGVTSIYTGPGPRDWGPFSRF